MSRVNEIAAKKELVLEVYGRIGTITGTARETGQVIPVRTEVPHHL